MNSEKDNFDPSLKLKEAYQLYYDKLPEELQCSESKNRYAHEHCYVIYNAHTGLYKIGIAIDANRRIREIELASGCDIDPIIIFGLEIGADEPPKTVESGLHNFFKNKKVKGEWYKLSLIDLYSISRLFMHTIGGGDYVDNLDEHVSQMTSKFNLNWIRVSNREPDFYNRVLTRMYYKKEVLSILENSYYEEPEELEWLNEEISTTPVYDLIPSFEGAC